MGVHEKVILKALEQGPVISERDEDSPSRYPLKESKGP